MNVTSQVFTNKNFELSNWILRHEGVSANILFGAKIKSWKTKLCLFPMTSRSH